MERKTNTNGTEPNEPATLTAMSKAVEEAGTVSPRKAGQARRRLRLGAGWRFMRHLLEMVVAMFAGMAVLGVALAVLGEPPGYANLFVRYGLMGTFMAAPMVGWMRYRDHAWSDGLEMTAAMLAPTFALVVPVELGVAVPKLSDGSLITLSHVAMIGGMVALMIYRPTPRLPKGRPRGAGSRGRGRLCIRGALGASTRTSRTRTSRTGRAPTTGPTTTAW
jgi:hypothetical protein